MRIKKDKPLNIILSYENKYEEAILKCIFLLSNKKQMLDSLNVDTIMEDDFLFIFYNLSIEHWWFRLFRHFERHTDEL